MEIKQATPQIPTFWSKNWFLIVVIIYVFIPIDLIPDRLPLLGTLDDTGMIIIEVLRRYANYKKTK